MAVQTSLTNVGLEQFVILLKSLFLPRPVYFECTHVSMHNIACITSV